MSFEKQPEGVAFPNIALEIRQMTDADRGMRERGREGFDKEVDVRNTARMKEIVAEVGWPTISKVGKESSYNAWLLVQHADHEVEFQELCLQKMKECPVDEVDQVNIAYLEDRVRLNRGGKQLYGTQFYSEGGGPLIPRPLEDESGVDERRARLGLPPLSEEIEAMNNLYFPKDEE